MKIKHTDKKRFRMPPMLTVLLGFLFVMFLGAFLLCLPISNTDGKWMSFTHAIYWATNGVCGTGLTVSPTSLTFTGFGQAMLFILIQFGGLGFMTFATMIFIAIGKRITIKDRIAIQEALGLDETKGVVRLVRNIAIMTGIIELTGAIMLAPFFCHYNGPIGIWQALFNAVSAFCNAGFDINGRIGNEFGSLTDFSANPGILLIIALLSILGAFGFPVINDVIKSRFRWRRYKLHTQIVLIAQLALMLFGTTALFITEFNSPAMADMNGGQKLLNSLFQSVMASSTAGFSSISQVDMSSTGRVISCVLMFIGASPCSTGGGIKTSTFAILVLMSIAGLQGKEEISMSTAKRSISFKNGMRAVTVTVLATMCVLTSVLIISMSDPGLPTGWYFYESITSFTTSGLSMGTSPTFSPIALYTQAIIMLIGRIGPMSVGTIFVKPDKSTLKYPPANIMIG